MPLLQSTTTNITSVDAIKAQEASRLKRSALETYRQLCAVQKDGIRSVWHNRLGLTPQQVCDALGADAAKSFALHGALTEAIVNMAQIDGVTPDISLPTLAFTVNGDGTVTVLDTPYVR